MAKQTKIQKRQNKIKAKAKESFDAVCLRINQQGANRARRAIAWIKEHKTTKLPQDFS